MSKFDVKDFQTSVKTVEEFDKVLLAYARSNPEKFKIKSENGEFEKFKRSLAGYQPSKVEEKVAEDEEVSDNKTPKPRQKK